MLALNVPGVKQDIRWGGIGISLGQVESSLCYTVRFDRVGLGSKHTCIQSAAVTRCMVHKISHNISWLHLGHHDPLHDRKRQDRPEAQQGKAVQCLDAERHLVQQQGHVLDR